MVLNFCSLSGQVAADRFAIDLNSLKGDDPMAQMQSAKPARKVSAGAAVGALVTIGVWVIETAGHTTVPAYVAVALSTLLAFVVSYLIPPSDSDGVVS